MSPSSENHLPDSKRLHHILHGYYVHEINDNWFIKNACAFFEEIVEKRGCKSVNQSSESNAQSDSCMVLSYCLMITDFLANYINDINTASLNFKNENLLKFFVKKWTIFEAATIKLDISYRPFRAYFTNRDQRYRNIRIYTVALRFWQLFSRDISRRVLKTVMKMIDKVRSGEVTSILLVQESMKLLVHIDKEVEKVMNITMSRGASVEMLETEFLYYKRTCTFYELQSVEMVLGEVTDYIKKVKNIIFEETYNCKLVYRMQPFVASLIKLTLSRIFIENQQSLLVTYFCGLLAANKETMLKDFYIVLKMSENPDLYEVFANCFYNSIILDGKCIMENRAQEFLSQPEQYIAAVLQITRKYIALVKTSFKGNDYFSKANKNALSSILNYSAAPARDKSTFESAKFFAIYCDYVLRNPQADVFLRDDELVYIFECLEDKLVFRMIFYELVVESLTCMTSLNEEYERGLLLFLRVFLKGYHSSIIRANIKEMIRDIKRSNDLCEEFSDSPNTDTELNVKVLKDENWPFSRKCYVEPLPRSLSIKIATFSEYYKITFPQRKLTFLHQISRADVTTHCFKKPYTFHMNLKQLSLLLQFNKAQSCSIKKLLEETKIDQKHFNQVLQSSIEVGILKYEEDTENPDCRTNVILNLNYESDKEYLILNKFKNEIRQCKISDYVISDENKCLAIQAAIVRIMKNKLFLHHEELVAQTFEVLKTKFVFTSDMVDKSIEKLIERMFIGRSEESERHYTYIP